MTKNMKRPSIGSPSCFAVDLGSTSVDSVESGQAVHIADDTHDLLEGAFLAGGFLILASDFACLLTIGCAGGTAMQPAILIPVKCGPDTGTAPPRY
jgi:hypothetical protein